LLKRSVSGLQGRFGVTTASRVVKPSVFRDSAWVNAAPAGPVFDPMIRSIWAISLPSPTSDSPMKKSAAIPASIVALLVKNERIWRNIRSSTGRRVSRHWSDVEAEATLSRGKAGSSCLAAHRVVRSGP